MLRTSAISALFVALATSASLASADECMCLNLNERGPWPQRVSELGDLEQRVLESFEVGPFFSSDGTLLSSALEPSGVLRREHRPSGEVLWCASPFDPRCSPASPSPEHPRASFSSGTSAASFERRHDWPLVRSIPIAMHADEGMPPSAGVRVRVERPPRS